MTSAPAPWREIAARVFVRRYAFLDQTIGAIVGDDAILLVDSRSTPAQARELLAEAHSLAAGRLSVVNTHWHWDHTFGNATVRPAPIWGHVRAAERLREDGGAARHDSAAAHPELAAELAAVEIDPPDRTFDRRAILDLGGRRVELHHLGRGHTDGDIVVVVPDAGVVFAGDLVEQGAPPWFGDGYPLDWPATLAAVLDLLGGALVPGHGEVVDGVWGAGQLAEITLVAERARRGWPDLRAANYDPAGPVPRGLAEDVARLLGWPSKPVAEALGRAFLQLAGRI